MDEAADDTVTGVVDSIDQDLARVLIGQAEDEWFFPRLDPARRRGRG